MEGTSSTGCESPQTSPSTPPSSVESRYPNSSQSRTPSHSSSGRERNVSYTARTNTPSPLRYATSYSSSNSPSASSSDLHHPPITQSAAQPIQNVEPQKPNCAPSSMYQLSKAHRQPSRHPIYSQSTSISNTHSGTSSSSSAPAGPSQPDPHQRPSSPRTSGPTSTLRSSHTKAVLIPNRTWNTDESKTQKHTVIPSRRLANEAHLPFLPIRRRQPPSLQIHPLLAHTRLQRPPIAYDIAHPPSPPTLIDRRTRLAISAHTLAQPATKPFNTDNLVLKSPKLPWAVTATSARTEESQHGSQAHSKSRLNAPPVTNLDVLRAIHITLAARVTPQEWAALGHGSRAQRRVVQEYERRCVRTGGGWDEGVRRIDYLCGKTLFIGIEGDKSIGDQNVIGRLVFANP